MAVILTINGHTTEAIPGLSLFDHAERLGVRVPTSCQKQGKCKECIIEVVEGADCLSPVVEQERHLNSNFRLSCRCTVTRETGRVRCHTMRRGRMRIERGGRGLPFDLQLDAAVRRVDGRILIDDVEVDRSTGPIHGLAVDLGTTTIVMRLYNLETGALIADTSFENPQRFGGSDVMARISYDCEHRGKLLMRTAAGYMRHAIEEFPVNPATIYEVVVAGNSTMRDLYFRQDVYSIGQNPYRSITEIEMAEGKRTTTSLTTTGLRSLLRVHPKARVYGMPIISGHVGADAAACMLAVNLAGEDRLVTIMDIGTNTELIMGNRDRIVAASCPAGPAFEGGGITCGMPALDGAIEDVAIDADGSFRLSVIGDVPPEGICGSGLVDVLSELIRTGRMNPLGRFQDDGSTVDLGGERGVVFLESDASALAQAKGANAAGLQVVAHQYGVGFDEIEVFYLAGGFGRHLKPDAARRIGLIPDLEDSKVVQAGNAAIEGASIALLSKSKRQELEALVRKVEHCRLETHPAFFDYFVEGCQFKPLKPM
jgi:uncharacterized 2Fe-2S/4Fe-4S cluster protein (DUF4445 family)